jgi:hypothetical protein
VPVIEPQTPLHLAAPHSVSQTTALALDWTLLTEPLFVGKHCLNPSTQTTGPGWRVADQPFTLSAEQGAFLRTLGTHLWRFMQAAQALYTASSQGTAPAFVAQWLDRGKPADLLALAHHPSQRHRLPHVIRPDVLLTETGYAVCELDAVPGGLGFVAALNAAYAGWQHHGLMAPPEGLPTRFWHWLCEQLPPLSQGGTDPVVVIALCEESADYTLEWAWLSEAIRQATGGRCHVVDVDQLSVISDRLGYTNEADQWVPVDLVYRFYELFSRADHAGIARIEAAQQAGLVAVTPPANFVQEEKLWLALWHHPALRGWWTEEQVPPDTAAVLDAIIPPGWAVSNDEAGRSQTLAALKAKGIPIKEWAQLGQASQKERQLVLKPSGFSPLAWGSRGVSVGHDLPGAIWAERVAGALAVTNGTPWVLQRFAKPASVPVAFLPGPGEVAQPFEGRVRLCPYYLVSADGSSVELVSVLATVCPKDKKVIHGMSTAVMAPCRVG